MSAPDPAPAADPAAARLDDVFSRLWVSYRETKATTQTTPPKPARVTRAGWESVLRDLHEAMGLVSGLAAGHTDLPVSYDQLGEMLPCGRCDGRTACRIHGAPWHYACWMAAGCPVEPPAATHPEKAPEQPTEAPSEAPETDSSAAAESTQEETLTAAGFERRQRDREHFTVDPAQELHDFSRAVRKVASGATDDDCAAALEAWHRYVVVFTERRPVSYVSSETYTGITLYDLLTARNGSMVQPEPLQSPLVREITGNSKTHNSWSFLDPDIELTAGAGVTELDVTAQYLAAAGSTECGDGEPDELDVVDPATLPALVNKSPGYLQLATRPDLSGLNPAARFSFAALDTGSWLPMPAAKYLIKDCSVSLDVARAVVWPDKTAGAPARFGRRLAVWATVVREARLALTVAAIAEEPGAALALRVIKTVYAAFLGGGLRSEEHNDRGTLRWDWSDMLRSTAGVNAIRALDKADVAPFGGMKDSFWFASDAADLPLRPAGLQYADQPGDFEFQPGKWHLNRHGLVTDDLVRHHAQGRVGLVRKAITAADKARKAAQ